MNIEELLALEDALGGSGTATPRLLSRLVTASAVKTSVDIDRLLTEEFDIFGPLTEEIVDWLLSTDILLQTDQTGDAYSVNVTQTHHLLQVSMWLFSNHSIESLRQAIEENPVSARPVYTVPERSGQMFQSNLTGYLVDLLASATDTATILNPFYTEVALSTIQEAIAGVTRRGARFRLLTRDIFMGDCSNQTHIRTLVDFVDVEGEMSNFYLYEFNQNKYHDSRFHAKGMISDTDRAFVGSANLTTSSLRSSFELGVVLQGKVVRELTQFINQVIASDLFERVDLGEV